MAKLTGMEDIKLILKTYARLRSYKATSRQLHISKNTVKKFVQPVEASSISVLAASDLCDADLAKLVYAPVQTIEQDARYLDLKKRIPFYFKELKREGVTRRRLWEEYKIEQPDGFQYSRFCEILRIESGRQNLTLPLQHEPGKNLQLDFAGGHMYYVDKSTGECIKCEVLVGILPHSGYTYMIALPSQKTQDFVYGITKTFEFIGGVPRAILSDNLKSYVSKPDRYEPDFTQLCKQLGAHYLVDLNATRVKSPKDKGSVENAVKNVYARIYAPLRDETFYSIEELNDAILQQLDLHNARPFQKREGSRLSVFESDEKPRLNELPCDNFVITKETRAKIQKNYHAFLGETKHFYSVPHQYVGRSVQVKYTRDSVSIYFDNQRIATHKRYFGPAHQYVTKVEHMPEKHKKFREIEGYNADYFLNQAKRIGEHTEWAIQTCLASRYHEEQSYKSCVGILLLAKKYTNQRLEAAAKICKERERVDYKALKNILVRKQDIHPPKDIQLIIPFHENIRGAEAYV